MINIIEFLLSHIAPHNCQSCGLEGQLLCATCLPDSLDPVDGICYRCHQASTNSNLCNNCRPLTCLQNVWAVTVYNKSARQLLSSLKFKRARAGANIISYAISQSLSLVPPDTIVTHIPTANSRVRQRGYDQSQLIARSFARNCGLSYRTLLLRHGNSRQLGASRQGRKNNLQHAYSVISSNVPIDSPILLIDDVLTTGSTIEAATKTLARSGYTYISAALFAFKL